MNNDSLAGLNVLVTRPAQQQSAFISLLEQEGAQTTSLPCLAIVPLETDSASRVKLQKVHETDAVIFISTNAVQFAHTILPMPWSPRPQRILAIGPTTATALAERGMTVSVTPEPPYNSESLLSLPPVVDWLHRKQLQTISLIKGQGGRPFLRNSLRKHGITIDSIDVYRRMRPDIPDATLTRVFLNSPPDIVTITSDEALTNLADLAGPRHQATLLKLPLVVNSERSAALAHQLGFQSQILVAPVPGDTGQLAAIKQWIRSYRHKL
ncbi:MAG: uroporphyrinogen-III synthase [Gammaproteobacteria bacterium]|nr:uroporphyrinogen-III synthase [Gammaproteobacteria bacterium]